MKRSMFFVTLCVLATSGAALAEPRDTGSDSRHEDDDSGGPGGTRLALDLDYANGLEPGVEGGMGGAIRFGREYDLVLLSLTPEFMGSFHQFSGAGDPTQFAGMAGGRATIGKIIEPGVFAHVGAGHASLPTDDLTGIAMDLGVTLDLTLIPILDIGVHGAYDAITWADEGTFDSYRVGAHIAIAP